MRKCFFSDSIPVRSNALPGVSIIIIINIIAYHMDLDDEEDRMRSSALYPERERMACTFRLRNVGPGPQPRMVRVLWLEFLPSHPNQRKKVVPMVNASNKRPFLRMHKYSWSDIGGDDDVFGDSERYAWASFLKLPPIRRIGTGRE